MTFATNGSVASVTATIKQSNPFDTNTWINICDIPSWFKVYSYWVEVKNGNGNRVGIWSVDGGSLSIFIHDATCNNAIVTGVLMVQ